MKIEDLLSPDLMIMDLKATTQEEAIKEMADLEMCIRDRDKGVSRRPGFSESLTAYANKAFLTTDDPGFEDPMDIAQEIDAGIDHEKVDVTIELDREKAIHDAIAMSNKDDIVLICGKGADPFQKIRGVDTPYPTDIKVAESVINELEKDDEEEL